MKYYRFMSKDEYLMLAAGEVLENKNTHNGRRTTSEGFCFLGEDSVLSGSKTISFREAVKAEEKCLLRLALWKVSSNYPFAAEAKYEAIHARDIAPVDVAYEWLRGVVTSEVFVELEGPDEMEKGYGVYADPFTDGWYDRCSISEYSCKKYSTQEYTIKRVWERALTKGHELVRTV